MGSESPPGGPGEVGRRSRRCRCGREAHLEVRVDWEGWEAHPEIQKVHPDILKGSGGPHRGLGGVERPIRRSKWPTWRARRDC